MLYTDERWYSEIAFALRNMYGTHRTYHPSEMASAIRGLPYAVPMINEADVIADPDTAEGYEQILVSPKPSFLTSSLFTGKSAVGVVYPNVDGIGAQTFANCSKLEFASFATCLNVNYNAFYSAKALRMVSLPKCSSIGTNTFFSCIRLSSVYMPECIYVGASAFVGCRALTTISLPKCGYIYQSAFYSCSSLSEVYAPVCQLIGDYALAYTSNLNLYLTSVPSLPRLGSRAMVGVRSVYIPASLHSMVSTTQYWSYVTSTSIVTV